MGNIYVRDVIEKCGGKLLFGEIDLVLDNFCTDSRVVKKDDVFVCIKGDNFDGNNFYLDVVEKGAKCIIISRMIDGVDCSKVTTILVEDTVKCLQDLAMYKRSLYNIPVVAVTGSVGKTSTKDIIYSILSTKYKTLKTSGNFNNHIGVPLTILGLHDHEAMVIEMGMNHLGEISLLSNIVKPTIGVITNVGTAHIGNLGSRENILKAKLEILDGMIGNDIVINYDNDMLYKGVKLIPNGFNIHTVSIENDSLYRAININRDVFSSKFDIFQTDKDIVVNVGGDAFIYNSLIAYSVGNILNIGNSDIKKGINNFKLSSHRLEKIINTKGVIIIDDTYNANFDSMKGSIELVGMVKDKRKILILGDMLELGDYSVKLHSDLGDVVFNSNVDVLITVGNLSKNISKRALELGFNGEVYNFFDESKVSKELLDSFNNNDIILLKGSHGMNLINIVNRLCK